MKLVSDEVMNDIASQGKLLEQYRLAYTDYVLGSSQMNDERMHQARKEMAHVEKMALSVWGNDFWKELRQSVGLDVY